MFVQESRELNFIDRSNKKLLYFNGDFIESDGWVCLRRPRLSEIEQKVQKLEVDSLLSADLAAKSGRMTSKSENGYEFLPKDDSTANE